MPDAIWLDLLDDDTFLRLSADAASLKQIVEAADAGRWIVIDEVQRLPKLLDVVHQLLTTHPDDYRFALSGSSARKLRRLNSNLLAGRAIERSFFPLTATEIGDTYSIDRALDTGTLPLIWTQPASAVDRLKAYVNVYLKQEIQQEAMVNDIASFSRFLRAASILNGHALNYSNISRDAGVSRSVVERYFSILVDTLIGFWLPAWQPKATVKEVAKPKFFFFDCGVVRACANRLGLPLSAEERGFLLETLIVGEIRAYLNASNAVHGELSYWKSGSGNEVDLIWSWGDTHIGIEIKSSKTWKPGFERGLRTLLSRGKLSKAIGIYMGAQPLRQGDISIYPATDFIHRLHKGELLTPNRVVKEGG